MLRNKLEIQFFGLQRSGNHGVITWLLQQFEHPQYFLNNIAHFEDPFNNYRHTDVPNMVPLNRQDIENTRECQKELLLCSYENLYLPKLQEQTLIPDSENTIGRSKNRYQIIIIREFYNWIVSRLKLYEIVGQKIDPEKAVPMLVELWIIYAQEFCGHTSYLKENPVRVMFDLWVVDEGYRENLLREIGVAVSDNSNTRVPRGGGSSFNEDQGRSRVSTEGVLSRWNNADIDVNAKNMIESAVSENATFSALYQQVCSILTQKETDARLTT